MAKCPKCGREIKVLHTYDIKGEAFYFKVSAQGKPLWIPMGVGNVVGPMSQLRGLFMCHKCGKELFDDYGEAAKFLR